MSKLSTLERRVLTLEKTVKSIENSEQYILWKFLVDNGAKYTTELKRELPQLSANMNTLLDECIALGCIEKSGRKFVAKTEYNWSNAKKQNKKVVDQHETENNISAKDDTDIKKYLKKEYLNNLFDKFNEVFFKNKITKIPVTVANNRELAGGYCESKASKNIIKPSKICIYNKVFKNRYVIENILVHEMCHAYQTEVLCNSKLDVYTADCEAGTGTHGHGPKFFQAANLVNNSPKNTEKYEVSQYCGEDAFTNHAFRDISGAVGLQLDGLVLWTINLSKKDLETEDLKNISLFKYKNGNAKTFAIDVFGSEPTENHITDSNSDLFKLCELITNGSLVMSTNATKNIICISTAEKKLTITDSSKVKRFSKSNAYYTFDGPLKPLSMIAFEHGDYKYGLVDAFKIKKLLEIGALKQVTSKKDEDFSYTNEDLEAIEHDENIETLSEIDNIDVEEEGNYDIIRTF